MKISQVAAQLHPVRDHLRDAAALAATARKPRGIGCAAVPLSAVGPIAPAEQCGDRWFIVEQGTCPGDPFESPRLSFDHFTTNLAA